jgi:hypothetical protein
MNKIENQYVVEEIIMEAKQENGSILKKRVRINGKKVIWADEWEDVEDGSSNN